jgi:hypothetical protein
VRARLGWKIIGKGECFGSSLFPCCKSILITLRLLILLERMGLSFPTRFGKFRSETTCDVDHSIDM